MGNDSLWQESLKELKYKSIQEAYLHTIYVLHSLVQLSPEVVKFGKNHLPLSTCLLTNEIRLFAIKRGTALR